MTVVRRKDPINGVVRLFGLSTDIYNGSLQRNLAVSCTDYVGFSWHVILGIFFILLYLEPQLMVWVGGYLGPSGLDS